MVGAALLLTTWVRLTGTDINSLTPVRPAETRLLRFVDRPDGSVAVYGAPNDTLVALLPGGTNGFLRATMRNFARARRASGIGPGAPFRLIAGTDGRLVLEDPSTATSIDLEAFGQTNAAAFANFLRN